MTLLIIDDNCTDRANYNRMLTKHSGFNCNVIEAENAKTAIEILEKKEVDCILLDYMLPDKNGLQLLKFIKDKFNDLIPVIMLTGQGDENIAVSAMKEGAVDYLVKDTIRTDILIKTIENAIKSSRLKKTIQEQNEQLEYYAYYDSLTGLINRHTFEELMRQALAYAQRHNDMLAIILCDLDNFISINDTLGQLAGDTILIETAKRLKQALPEEIVVARWGDDEFAVLITGPDIKQSSTKIANAILDEIKKPITLTADEIKIGASVGIACYPINSTDIIKLIKNAATALNQAKNKGRGIILHYTIEMK